MKKSLLIVCIVIILVGLFCLCRILLVKNEVVNKNTEGVITTAIFNCLDKKTIQSIFLKDRVELNLSDGRSMLLIQAVSASGARYANTDESFIFWNKGNTAFITEGNKNTYVDCLATTTSSN